MDEVDVLREIVQDMEKLWADVGKIVNMNSMADMAYLTNDLNLLKAAIKREDF